MPQSESSLLRASLWANALFSGFAGIDLIVFSSRLAEILGLGDPRILVGLGIGLLAWATHLIVATRRKTLSMAEAWYFVSGDVLWVVGSVVLIASDLLTPAGDWLTGIAAVLVLAIAEAQFLGIRRIQRRPSQALREAA